MQLAARLLLIVYCANAYASLASAADLLFLNRSLQEVEVCTRPTGEKEWSKPAKIPRKHEKPAFLEYKGDTIDLKVRYYVDDEAAVDLVSTKIPIFEIVEKSEGKEPVEVQLKFTATRYVEKVGDTWIEEPLSEKYETMITMTSVRGTPEVYFDPPKPPVRPRKK